MDWTVPCYCRLPDPDFEIPVDDFYLPVIRLPEELLSERLQGERVHLHALLGFVAPPGNIKRIPASYMLARAVETGLLQAGDTLVEPTSGNMGLSLAYCAQRYGVTVAALVSDSLPQGKLLALQRHGARVVKESDALAYLGLTTSPGCIELARRYAKTTDAVFLNQYANAWNPESYATLVAPALWEQIGGSASLFVSAVGSTGTLIGIGGFLKNKNPAIEIVATMPHPGQSIGGTRDAERLKEIRHDWRALDPVIQPIDQAAALAASRLLDDAGIPGGPSSGAAFGAAEQFLLDRLAAGTLDALRGDDGTIGVILPFADTVYPYG
ncbi:MAG TPA: pyridoxal-phosphate dependent enzyme [Rhizomicrobium sp.]|nr:pyridoxal-phosphate dependent enzyme [Rhizomicrobium sp.]